jgi:hypothetical protein
MVLCDVTWNDVVVELFSSSILYHIIFCCLQRVQEPYLYSTGSVRQSYVQLITGNWSQLLPRSFRPRFITLCHEPSIEARRSRALFESLESGEGSESRTTSYRPRSLSQQCRIHYSFIMYRANNPGQFSFTSTYTTLPLASYSARLVVPNSSPLARKKAPFVV